MGAGHVMRCLTLADGLIKQGVKCIFVCRPHPGNMIQTIEQHGHRVRMLPEVFGEFGPTPEDTAYEKWLSTDWRTDAIETVQLLGGQLFDWMIVDHYSLDIHWEKRLRSKCRKLMVIDDLANRSHDCDLLLDQNLGRKVKDYDALIPNDAATLIGPRYALLRPEFSKLRGRSLKRRKHPELKHLLISMGGMDKDNVTGKVLNALNACSLPADLQISVVLGAQAPWLEEVKQQAAIMKNSTNVLVDVEHMAELMVESDFSIGAAGTTSWERCCLGLPSVVIVIADNQIEGAMALGSIGAAFIIQNIDSLQYSLKSIFSSDMHSLHEMAMSAAIVAEGNGSNDVVQCLFAYAA